MSKLVTICVPTFNSEESLAETLESLAQQTYSNMRVIIFDNCSTDKTVEIAEIFQEKFSNFEVRISRENIGAEGNFTRCLQVSDSDYTAIFHADDIYERDIIERQVCAFEECPTLLAVATHAREINSLGKKMGERFLPKELKENSLTILDFDGLLNLTLMYGNIITCPSVMAKTEVYSQQIKSWNGADFKSSADLDVWLRISKLGGFGFLNKPLVNYRVAEVSTSFRMKKNRVSRHDMFLVIDKYYERLEGTTLSIYYDFLNLKDTALRAYNGSGESINPFKLSFFKLTLRSIWHRSFYLKILFIWFVSLLGIRK